MNPDLETLIQEGIKKWKETGRLPSGKVWKPKEPKTEVESDG